MTIIASFLLGIIEGVTEFLPISSTGHMILLSNLLTLTQTEFLKSFEIIIQLGAILAVVAIYWHKLLVNMEILKRVIVAFIPTGIIGLALYKIIKSYLLGNNAVVLWALFIGGVVIILFELWQSKIELRGEASKLGQIDNSEKISYKQAVGLGLFQSMAIIPGVSRSAATIIGGLAMKIKRETIVEFSFLLAVPTMMAATGLDLVKNSLSFSKNEVGLLLIGFCVSFLVALLAVKTFVAYVQKHSFIVFGVYRLILATAFASFLYLT
jgi:undecaprenyl-diphosphatase